MNIEDLQLPVLSPSGVVQRISLRDLKDELNVGPDDLYYQTNICEGDDGCPDINLRTTVATNRVTFMIDINPFNVSSSNRCIYFTEPIPLRTNIHIDINNRTERVTQPIARILVVYTQERIIYAGARGSIVKTIPFVPDGLFQGRVQLYNDIILEMIPYNG